MGEEAAFSLEEKLREIRNFIIQVTDAVVRIVSLTRFYKYEENATDTKFKKNSFTVDAGLTLAEISRGNEELLPEDLIKVIYGRDDTYRLSANTFSDYHPEEITATLVRRFYNRDWGHYKLTVNIIYKKDENGKWNLEKVNWSESESGNSAEIDPEEIYQNIIMNKHTFP